MLEYLGERKAGARIEEAVRRLLVERKIATLSAGDGLPTTKIGEMVVAALG